MSVHVELFGIARSRAGVAAAEVEATTLGEALRRLAGQHTALADEIIDGDRPAAGYLVSLNGERFIDDPATPLDEGAALLILSGQAGG